MMKTVKFALMADPHFELVPEGHKKLDEFLSVATKENVDFIIHLGDFCYPTDRFKCRCPVDKMPINIKNAYGEPCPSECLDLIKKFNSFEKPSYHVCGNHEFDFASLEDVMKAYDMESNYYAIHHNGWHFIVLDGNYIKTQDGKYEHYDFGHYFWQDLPWLSDEQLIWLEEELTKTDEPIVIFSHEPLFDYEACVKNYEQVQSIIKKARQKGKEVLMCINGHLHVDDLHEIDGVLYYNANSMTNMWVDLAFETRRFSDEIEEKYPNIRYTIPYSRPVYAIVTLDSEGVTVKGVEGDYVKPGPDEIGYKKKISPSSNSWKRRWKKKTESEIK